VNGDLTTAQIIIEDGAYFRARSRSKRARKREATKTFPLGRQLPRLHQRQARSRGVSSQEGRLRILR